MDNQILPKVIEYLKKRGWSHSQAKKDDSIFMSLSHDNGTYHCIFYIQEDSKLLSVVSYLGTRCPPDKMGAILGLVNKANNHLLYGNYEINGGGDIKFRTSIYLDDTEITDGVIEGLITRNILSIDDANPVFSKVMFGGLANDNAFELLYPPSNKTEDAEIVDEETTSKDAE
jgi:hypothetical protein